MLPLIIPSVLSWLVKGDAGGLMDVTTPEETSGYRERPHSRTNFLITKS
jgi:hypothetical protein